MAVWSLQTLALFLALLNYAIAFVLILLLTARPELERLRAVVSWSLSIVVGQLALFVRRAWKRANDRQRKERFYGRREQRRKSAKSEKQGSSRASQFNEGCSVRSEGRDDNEGRG